MTALVFALPILLTLLCAFLGAVFGPRYALKWWLLRLTAVPIIFFVLSVYVMVTPTPIPDNYDPVTDGNPGRLDFAAIMIYGIGLPLMYVIAALPVSLTYVIWKRRN